MRLIPPIERDPRYVQWAATPAGKLIAVLLFCLLFAFLGGPGTVELGALLLCVALWPKCRPVAVTLGTMYWWMVYVRLGIDSPSVIVAAEGIKVPPVDWPPLVTQVPSVLLTVIGICALYLALCRRFPTVGPFRRPILTLFLGYLTALACGSYIHMTPATSLFVWACLLVMAQVIWCLGYSVLDRRSDTPTPFLQQLGYYVSFWGWRSALPTAKGAAYLRRIEAKTEEEAAVTRLKALKLILWASVLHSVHCLFMRFATGQASFLDQLFGKTAGMAIPGLERALWQYLRHAPYPRLVTWESLFVRFAGQAMFVAIWGHTAVATVRMVGYRALRNSWRPFEARSLMEFYNRYYYYFKELLADFFFFPTYARYFKGHPRLRLLCATMAAATVGNFLVHFLGEGRIILAYGLFDALKRYHVSLVYTTVLGLLLGLSQMEVEAKRKRPPPGAFRSLVGWLAVMFFFSFSMIFAAPDPRLTIVDYVCYTANMFMPYPR